MKEITVFDSSNRPKERGFVNDLGKQGRWIYFFDNGSIFKEVQFKDNLEHGTFKRYFENGQIAVLSNFTNGVREGKGIEYYENGRPKEEWEYRNGKFFAISFWDENGVQTIIDGSGYKIEKYGYAEADVKKEFYKNGICVDEEIISKARYSKFIPKSNK